jgi:signal transduction histidine kinase
LDTKLKNKAKPLIAWTLFLVFTSITLLSGWDIFVHRAYFDSSYYFKSRAFYNQVDTHWNLVKYIHFDNRNYPQLTLEEKLKADWIKYLNESYDQQKRDKVLEINADYTSNLEDIGQQKPDVTQQTELPAAAPQGTKKEQADKIAEAKASIDSMLQKDINKYLAYKEQEYQDVKKSLDNRGAIFKYYIKDLGTGQIYTNMPGTPDQAQQPDQTPSLHTIVLPQNFVAEQAMQPINKYFQQHRLEGTFVIPLVVNESSQIHADYEYYLAIRDRIELESILFAISLLLASILFIAIRKFDWYLNSTSNAMLNSYQRIPLDMKLAILLLVCLFAFSYVHPSAMFQMPLHPGQFMQVLLLSLLAALLIIQFKEALFLYSNKEELQQQWQAAYSFKLIQLTGSSIADRNIFFKAMLVFIASGVLVISIIIGIIGLDDGTVQLVLISAVYILFFLLIVLPYVLKRISALNSILNGTEAIAAGNLNQTIEQKGRGNLAELAHHLNNMKAGFKTALEQQIRSERLKSELITNVSHDLKTPLTSIINYVDLLKTENITPEQRESYVGVLERKTQRLKTLIDDLFEASKMASGAAELTLESVNVTSLLNQALAELSEQIEASTLSLKVSVPDHKVEAILDGKKIWRVFENLIGNALKYAMPSSRVHISLTQNSGKIVFTIKNVSAYEIDFEVSELLERFKRGDSSRHTEGSGLGLAIAKSIVDLHGGELLIQIDGDYFKVIVTLG